MSEAEDNERISKYITSVRARIKDARKFSDFYDVVDSSMAALRLLWLSDATVAREAEEERDDAWKSQQQACAELEAHCSTCPRIVQQGAALKLAEEALADALKHGTSGTWYREQAESALAAVREALK